MLLNITMNKIASIVSIAALLFAAGAVYAQDPAPNPRGDETVATATNDKPSDPAVAPSATAPTLQDYKGIRIGMSADQVRSSLDHLKEKGERQDFFTFSDHESAQVFYDEQGNVTAISIDYSADGGNAPTARAVLGEDIEPKPDGSFYKLKRYPEAGYWVAYSRTAGDRALVTVTMQKMP